jgi:hypothetical protein
MANPDESKPAENEPKNVSANSSFGELKKASDDLKERIAEAKRRHDMPIDSALGNPNWEERAKDGRLDRPDDEKDD